MATTYTLTQTNGILTFSPVPVPPPPPVPPTPPATIQEPAIPTTAVVADMLHPASPWQMNHDPGTPGSSTGITDLLTTLDGLTPFRRFQFTLTANGGQIYHTVAFKDVRAYSNFVYETCELSPDPSNVRCFEKDIEFCDPDGTVHDMATQIADNVIEITDSHKWVSTGIKVPARTGNTWYTTRSHVKNNGDGTITYIGYSFGGVYYPINRIATNTDADKWAANIMNTQLQYDGKSTASMQTTIYMSKFNIYGW